MLAHLIEELLEFRARHPLRNLDAGQWRERLHLRRHLVRRDNIVPVDVEAVKHKVG